MSEPPRSLADPLGLGLAEAWSVIRAALPVTPLVRDPAFSDDLGRPVHFKLESLQPTGSFKIRGALARMARLSDAERRAGVVTCSSGNHGRATAWSAARLGISAVVCVPGWVDPVKLRAMRELGAEVRLVGDTYDEAAAEAERVAGITGRVLIHPFDDPGVVAGQGTVALEILDQLPDVADVLVPLSGGGLVGGMAYALESAGSRARVTAVSARNARVMAASLEAGHPVDLPEEPTLASALAGGIGLGNRWTFALVRDQVADHREVSEAEIARAMVYGYRQLGLVLEGGGATALASLLSGEAPAGDGPLVVVLSGGNVDPGLLAEILTKTPAAD